MLNSQGSMAGYMGHTVARIQTKGTGYANKALAKPKAGPIAIKKLFAPPSVRSLRTLTTNNVFNFRLGQNPITQDTMLSKLI